MSKPTFEHRHYVKLAAIFAEADSGSQHDREAATVLIGRFIRALAADNPRFDRERFLAAARGEPSNGRDRVR